MCYISHMYEDTRGEFIGPFGISGVQKRTQQEQSKTKFIQVTVSHAKIGIIIECFFASKST